MNVLLQVPSHLAQLTMDVPATVTDNLGVDATSGGTSDPAALGNRGISLQGVLISDGSAIRLYCVNVHSQHLLLHDFDRGLDASCNAALARLAGLQARTAAAAASAAMLPHRALRELKETYERREVAERALALQTALASGAGMPAAITAALPRFASASSAGAEAHLAWLSCSYLAWLQHTTRVEPDRRSRAVLLAALGCAWHYPVIRHSLRRLLAGPSETVVGLRDNTGNSNSEWGWPAYDAARLAFGRLEQRLAVTSGGSAGVDFHHALSAVISCVMDIAEDCVLLEDLFPLLRVRVTAFNRGFLPTRHALQYLRQDSNDEDLTTMLLRRRVLPWSDVATQAAIREAPETSWTTTTDAGSNPASATGTALEASIGMPFFIWRG
jgi:hypothetical protein